jgi:hypothetical protein
MSIEAALKAFIREVIAEAHTTSPITITVAPAAEATTVGKPRGRPAKGETAPIAASPASAPAPAASPATTTAAQNGAAPSAAPSVAGTAPPSLTHAQLAPIFLASGKKFGRGHVITVMAKFGAKEFAHIPAAKLAEAQTLLMAGPQAAPAVDVTDLMG